MVKDDENEGENVMKERTSFSDVFSVDKERKSGESDVQVTVFGSGKHFINTIMASKHGDLLASMEMQTQVKGPTLGNFYKDCKVLITHHGWSGLISMISSLTPKKEEI